MKPVGEFGVGFLVLGLSFPTCFFLLQVLSELTMGAGSFGKEAIIRSGGFVPLQESGAFSLG